MKTSFDRWEIVFVCAVVFAGLALRIQLALMTFFNPDEALYAVSTFGSFREALHNAIRFPHPPFLAVITYLVARVSRTEFALRLVPVLAGSAFPLLLFFWLRRLAGGVAAMAALLLLELSPSLIALSAQLRNYMLAFFFLSASLLALETALRRNRWQWMAVYSLLLWLCIVSDFSVAWCVVAAGIYVLLRFLGSDRACSLASKGTWAAGQAVALMLYALLFAFQIQRFRTESEKQHVVDGWLREAYPHPGHMMEFPIANSLKQFSYLMASEPMGRIAFVAFVAGIILLWIPPSRVQRKLAWPLAVLLVLPFLLGIAGAYAHESPYGGSRQSCVLGVFGAMGIGIFVSAFPRRIVLALVGGMLLLATLWPFTPYPETISQDWDQKQQIKECLEYMRANIPPEVLVFTEDETFNVLAYYAGNEKLWPPTGIRGAFEEKPLGSRWRVATRDYGYVTREAYDSAMAAFRRQYGLRADEPVWVLDGGWVQVTPPDERLRFTRAVRVYQAR